MQSTPSQEESTLLTCAPVLVCLHLPRRCRAWLGRACSSQTSWRRGRGTWWCVALLERHETQQSAHPAHGLSCHHHQEGVLKRLAALNKPLKFVGALHCCTQGHSEKLPRGRA